MPATPIPMIVPPSSSGRGPSAPKPTMSSPTATTMTATSMLRIVTGTLYWIICSSMVNPSIAMKCMTQMPVTPIDTAASSSHLARDAPSMARARLVHCRPRKQPRHDTR